MTGYELLMALQRELLKESQEDRVNELVTGKEHLFVSRGYIETVYPSIATIVDTIGTYQ